MTLNHSRLISFNIAIFSIEAAWLSRVSSCGGGGLTQTVFFMAVTEAAVNIFFDHKKHTNLSLLPYSTSGRAIDVLLLRKYILAYVSKMEERPQLPRAPNERLMLAR